jgi:UDP-N-acetylmuramate dehydrogenase
MVVENNVALQPYNSFGIVARAQRLVRVRREADLIELMASADWPSLTREAPPFVLGGGSNLVITGDVKPLVI